jgi:hypothetical protein
MAYRGFSSVAAPTERKAQSKAPMVKIATFSSWVSLSSLFVTRPSTFVLHLITLSAWYSTVCGIVRPAAWRFSD